MDFESNLLAQIEKLQSEKIFFWGASLFLRDFLVKNYLKKYNILGIIDKNEELRGTLINNYEVFTPEILKEYEGVHVIHTIKNDSQKTFLECKYYVEINKLDCKLHNSIFNPPNFADNIKLKYCPFCDKEYFFLGFNNRQGIRCMNCNSLERHRFLYFIYKMFVMSQDRPIKLLHLAPEESIYNLFQSEKNIEYTCIDLEPSRYPYAKSCLKMDALDLHFASETFDFILCNHVAEHIEDEALFFKELLRVLKKDGKIILTVPYSLKLEKTFEDANIKTDDERLKYYGQEDHVRKYGKDVFVRFAKYGKITRINREAFSGYLTDKLNINNPFDAVMFIEKLSKLSYN